MFKFACGVYAPIIFTRVFFYNTSLFNPLCDSLFCVHFHMSVHTWTRVCHFPFVWQRESMRQLYVSFIHHYQLLLSYCAMPRHRNVTTRSFVVSYQYPLSILLLTLVYLYRYSYIQIDTRPPPYSLTCLLQFTKHYQSCPYLVNGLFTG